MSASPIKSVVSGGVNPFASFGSTGGKVFTLPVMDGDDGDDSGAMDMEETVAMGGILSGGNRADESATTDGENPEQENPTLSFGNALRGEGAANDDEDAMEFTVAVGGILAAGGAVPTFAMNVTSPTASSIEASGVHTPGPTSATPKKDSAPGTPSFARPTAASEARSFQPTSPTPSQIAQPTSRNQTPTRLSLFSSGTPSKSAGTPRRALNDAAQAGNVIARSPYQGNMGTPVKSPAKRTNLFGTPSPTKNVSSRGNPLPSPSPSKRPSIAPSPARSPARSNIFSRAPVVEETPASPAWAHEGAYEQISLAAFLEMTGVQFMEGMPTGQRRKSIMPTGRDHARLSEGLSGEFPSWCPDLQSQHRN
jgi:kinetochore protein Spc7/SPC105